MLPPVAVQVTPVLLALLTVAVNCCVPPVSSEAETGDRLTDTTALVVTLIAADAETVASAALVAVTT
jgi:hypothetical protein